MGSRTGNVDLVSVLHLGGSNLASTVVSEAQDPLVIPGRIPQRATNPPWA